MGATCCSTAIDDQQFQQFCQKNISVEHSQFFNQVLYQIKKQIQDGKSIKQSYIIGDWQQGCPMSGNGIIYAPNFFLYYGEIQYSQANGNGTIMWADHNQYKGKVKNNKANGFGTFKIDNMNLTMQGQWQKGVPRVNQRIRIDNNMQKATIIFKQSLLNQNETSYAQKVQVVVQFDKGNIYKGPLVLKNDRFSLQGQGQMTFQDGSYYKGEFKNAKMHGKGIFVWSNRGHKYQGQYVQNFRSGKGRYYLNQHQYKQGTWKGGRLIAQETTK